MTFGSDTDGTIARSGNDIVVENGSFSGQCGGTATVTNTDTIVVNGEPDQDRSSPST